MRQVLTEARAQMAKSAGVSIEDVPEWRLRTAAQQAGEDHIRRDCPGVTWIGNYAVLGTCDYLDIFEASDNETATKVALIVRSFGHATTETWLATPWDRFMSIAEGLK
jgi:uncharacterized protein with GYD domain